MTSVSKVLSVAPVGFDGFLVEVESHATRGLPSLQIVGLGNKAIDEAKERVRSAITNSLLDFPATHITINLAPAELPKDGTHYDVPIALAILASSGQLKSHDVDNNVFAGELALDGRIRPIKGVIAIAEAARAAGATALFLPKENAAQASLIEGIDVYGVATLEITPVSPATPSHDIAHSGAILDDIVGQEQAKRALIIAAAGRHNILLSGSPGAGKTMLAKTLAQLLPPLTPQEQIAATKLHSLAGETIQDVITSRPFRSPHHTASRASLIGGGSKPKPGEISLAHLGILFLDEIPEYPRATLEALRQPLEDKRVTITRAGGFATYPADFTLIATMNPCPCGYYGDSERECSCSSTQILAYQKRLSGPLLDRIDMTINVSRVPNEALLGGNSKINTQHTDAKNSVQFATNAQRNRYNSSDKYNANITNTELRRHAPLMPAASTLLNNAANKMALSARSYFKIIKVARTIADLDGAANIDTPHIAEALQYRQKA